MYTFILMITLGLFFWAESMENPLEQYSIRNKRGIHLVDGNNPAQSYVTIVTVNNQEGELPFSLKKGDFERIFLFSNFDCLNKELVVPVSREAFNIFYEATDEKMIASNIFANWSEETVIRAVDVAYKFGALRIIGMNLLSVFARMCAHKISEDILCAEKAAKWREKIFCLNDTCLQAIGQYFDRTVVSFCNTEKKIGKVLVKFAFTNKLDIKNYTMDFFLYSFISTLGSNKSVQERKSSHSRGRYKLDPLKLSQKALPKNWLPAHLEPYFNQLPLIEDKHEDGLKQKIEQEIVSCFNEK